MNNELTSWNELNHRVYWHRVMALEDWQDGISKAKPTYLPDAVKRMSTSDFIQYYGKDKFKSDWPRLRSKLPHNVKKICGLYDISWSLLLSNSYNLQPTEDFFDLDQSKQSILIQIAQNPGITIEEMKLKNIVHELIISGKIATRNENGQLNLYPSYEYRKNK